MLVCRVLAVTEQRRCHSSDASTRRRSFTLSRCGGWLWKHATHTAKASGPVHEHSYSAAARPLLTSELIDQV